MTQLLMVLGREESLSTLPHCPRKEKGWSRERERRPASVGVAHGTGGHSRGNVTRGTEWEQRDRAPVGLEKGWHCPGITHLDPGGRTS